MRKPKIDELRNETKSRYYVGFKDGHHGIYHSTLAKLRTDRANLEPWAVESIIGPFKGYDFAKWFDDNCDGPNFMDVEKAERLATAEFFREGEKIRADCLDSVNRLGKFQGEQIYLPYYWERSMHGCEDSIWRGGIEILSCEITAREKIIFPELRKRRRVKFYTDDQGFVREV